ncbi:MAG: D-alanyl-D-alanine carboxypeptidase [Clostridiales bacterium]|jgi:D-alanyl-D-alanine carboxypeptidase (penicillin-binding protein 5/6)|nr:D-alanyl-D-alanine carboxypeptidase [Clostridiales bacterium]
MLKKITAILITAAIFAALAPQSIANANASDARPATESTPIPSQTIQQSSIVDPTGQETLSPVLVAQSAILMERSTGKIVYDKDADERIYPASMTKILTALTALDYLKPDEILVVGDEMHQAPSGSSIAYLREGEAVSVENLMRALLIASGNEAACTIALNAAKRARNAQNMAYDEAEQVFSQLMNNMARKLGAYNTHFTNPHGFHDDDHYSTAKDIALLSSKLMDNELLSKIVAEQTYKGQSVDMATPPDGSSLEYHEWNSHNEIIKQGEYYYPYATGIKTGFTSQAGNCLASSANKNGLEFISVVCFSPEPNHWLDTIALFDYGFNNYAFRQLNLTGVVERAAVDNPRLGMEQTIEIYAEAKESFFMSTVEFESISQIITYFPEFVVEPGEGDPADSLVVKGPFAKNARLGAIKYTLGDKTLLEAPLLASAEVLPRTVQTDMDYYWQQISNTLFTEELTPLWIGGAALLCALLIFIIIVKIKNARRNRHKDSLTFSRGGRYSSW